MTEPIKPSKEAFDDADILADGDVDLGEFVDAMEGETSRRAAPQKPKRAGWQRVDDWQDARWLRDQLNDWEDWKD
jgi:hypothetical protein